MTNTFGLGGIALKLWDDMNSSTIIQKIEGVGIFNFEILPADEREEIRQEALKIREQIKARKNK